MKKLNILLIIVTILTMMLLFVACNTLSLEISLHFDSNGGSEVPNLNIGKEMNINIPENPTKEGYIFDGWYWDNDIWLQPLTINSLTDVPLSREMTVYAKWKLSKEEAENPPVVDESINFILYFDSNGGNEVPNINVKYNFNIDMPADPIKSGYKFVGWYWDNDVWLQPLTINSLINMPISEKTTVYAKWEKDEDKPPIPPVTTDLNGAEYCDNMEVVKKTYFSADSDYYIKDKNGDNIYYYKYADIKNHTLLTGAILKYTGGSRSITFEKSEAKSESLSRSVETCITNTVGGSRTVSIGVEFNLFDKLKIGGTYNREWNWSDSLSISEIVGTIYETTESEGYGFTFNINSSDGSTKFYRVAIKVDISAYQVFSNNTVYELYYKIGHPYVQLEYCENSSFEISRKNTDYTIDSIKNIKNLFTEKEIDNVDFGDTENFSGGYGTKENPYIVSSAVHFQNIGKSFNTENTYYKLKNDIDLREWNKPFVFSGNLDGDGHIISYTQKSIAVTDWYGGLFKELVGNANITNLLLDAEITKNTNTERANIAGILAARCSGNVTVSMIYILENSYISVRDINHWGSKTALGGLFGEIRGGRIEQCVNKANITAIGNWDQQVGGIVGYASPCTANIFITNCYNAGNILAYSKSPTANYSHRIAGGIAGLFEQFLGNIFSISRCYNDGKCEAEGGNGGWVFHQWWDTGAILATRLNSSTNGLNISDCYFNREKTVNAVHNKKSYYGVVGLTNENMSYQYNFISFDFSNIWVMQSINGCMRPRLKWLEEKQ